ncbi:MAG: hypothetical protein ACQJCO_01195 [cyanobacterium endosymbiont of Rhopalodia sterrenbergii]
MTTHPKTKFTFSGFTQALRGELVPYNIRVVVFPLSLTYADTVGKLK